MDIEVLVLLGFCFGIIGYCVAKMVHIWFEPEIVDLTEYGIDMIEG